MTSKSKTKGKSWERDVCNFLTELYNDSFIRVPNSGAYVGGKNEYRREHLTEEQIKLSRGDIIPHVKFPYFLAECKNYADFPFHQLLAKNSISQLANNRNKTPTINKITQVSILLIININQLILLVYPHHSI